MQQASETSEVGIHSTTSCCPLPCRTQKASGGAECVGLSAMVPCFPLIRYGINHNLIPILYLRFVRRPFQLVFEPDELKSAAPCDGR